MGSGSSTPGFATPRSGFNQFKSTQDEDESLATIATMLAEDLKRLEDRDHAARIQQGRDWNGGDEDERFAFEEDEENGGTDPNEIALLRQQLDTVNSKLSRDRRARRKTEGVESNSIYARRVSQEQQHGVSEGANDDDFDFKTRERLHDKVDRDKRQAMADVEAMLGKDMAVSLTISLEIQKCKWLTSVRTDFDVWCERQSRRRHSGNEERKGTATFHSRARFETLFLTWLFFSQ